MLPNAELFSVRHSLVCESKAGFSTSAFTKIHMWFLTWNGFTGAALFFFLIWSRLLSAMSKTDAYSLLANCVMIMST